MAVTGIGLTSMVPNVGALTGALLLVIALHLQLRVVEAPYLRPVHGAGCVEDAARTGRFLPRLGRLPRHEETASVGVES